MVVIVGEDVPGLSVDALLEGALQEVRGDWDDPMPHLVALHVRGDEEVYRAAVGRLDSQDLDERAWGVWILRELGPAGVDGRRPFSDRAVPRLRDLLGRGSVPRLERMLLQALAYNRAWEALPEFLARITHPDPGVRETVAFQLPYVVGPAGVGEQTAEAIVTLSRDVDADVRYYVLHAVVEECLDIGAERRWRILDMLHDDPDEQVRALARNGAAASIRGEATGQPANPSRRMALEPRCRRTLWRHRTRLRRHVAPAPRGDVGVDVVPPSDSGQTPPGC